jgi:inhibitor of KinA sporulation pathway (predicted exonuclease)
MEVVNPSYYLVANVETTCDVDGQLDPKEVIEVSLVAVEVNTLSIISDFQRYVRPEVHSELTPFCVAQTGIGQSHVDQSDVLEDVLDEIKEWVEHLTQADDTTQLVSFDHNPMVVVNEQASDEELDLPEWCTSWVHLGSVFKRHFCLKGDSNLSEALNYLGITPTESGQQGVDKAQNAARLLIDLIKLDARMESVSDQDSHQPTNSTEGKPGDWACDRCGFLNFARRNFCKTCGDQRPGYVASPRSNDTSSEG